MDVHTNGIENSCRLFKQTLTGSDILVDEWHLLRYLGEQAFQFNERKGDDYNRFFQTMSGSIARRVEYAALIGKAE